MISIYNEIKEIEDGVADAKDNVLKNAPHTAAHVTSDEWTHPYSRQKAAYPVEWNKESKFFAICGEGSITRTVTGTLYVRVFRYLLM